jgi:outer membrane lipoprotein SlyB
LTELTLYYIIFVYLKNYSNEDIKMNKLSIVKSSKVISILLSLFVITSCAREISSEVYSANHVGEASTTYAGVIIHTRQVTVQEHERLEENGMGIVGGGVAGAIAGNQFGKGSGNTAATIGGALIGATAGAFAEKALKSQTGTEYVVQLDNGQTMTVVQGPNPAFSVGQNVYVIVGQQGRSRVVAR